MLWPTVILLVRQASARNPIAYDLTLRPVSVPEAPPRTPGEALGTVHGRGNPGPG